VQRASVFSFRICCAGCVELVLYVGVEVLAGYDHFPMDVHWALKCRPLNFYFGYACMYGDGIYHWHFSHSKIHVAAKHCAFCGSCHPTGIPVFNFGHPHFKYVSVGFIAALGLANSLCGPPFSPGDKGTWTLHKKIGSALLIMGIAGAALMLYCMPGFRPAYLQSSRPTG